MRNVFFYDFEGIGRVWISDDGKAITHVLFAGEKLPVGAAKRESPLIVRAAGQLREYLAGKRRTFDLPLSPCGTDFQRAVWRVLLEIPYGGTKSYRWVAERVGRPRAFRAVGGANNRNPIAVVVPCHRVIGADGSLVGYGGGLSIKEFLLELERRTLARTGSGS